jgi:predicted nucleotidyltransferase
MSEFTYKAPNEDSFLQALVVMLKTKRHDKIADLLSGSKCTIIDTKQWAYYHGGTLYN